MSKYPIWWSQAITVYNKFENSTTREVTWHKTNLDNCFWRQFENQLVLGETKISSDSIVCRVPIQENFKEKHEWELLDNKSDFFTFGPGDIIIRGTVNDVVNEYVANSRSSDLLKKYKRLQGCLVVSQCTISEGVGIGHEHYFIRGA